MVPAISIQAGLSRLAKDVRDRELLPLSTSSNIFVPNLNRAVNPLESSFPPMLETTTSVNLVAQTIQQSSEVPASTGHQNLLVEKVLEIHPIRRLEAPSHESPSSHVRSEYSTLILPPSPHSCLRSNSRTLANDEVTMHSRQHDASDLHQVSNSHSNVASSEQVSNTPRSKSYDNGTPNDTSPQPMSLDDTTLREYDGEEMYADDMGGALVQHDHIGHSVRWDTTQFVSHSGMPDVDSNLAIRLKDYQLATMHAPQNLHLKGERTIRHAENASGIFDCTFCLNEFSPTAISPLYLCPGCGPDFHAPRYCSVECLLTDTLQHANQCARFPAYARNSKNYVASPHYVYDQNALMTSAAQQESPEMFRQRTFSLYCRYGAFPKLAAAWCRRNSRYPFTKLLCDLDGEKLTGIYHVFESGHLRPGLVPNFQASVLFVSNACILVLLL